MQISLQPEAELTCTEAFLHAPQAPEGVPDGILDDAELKEQHCVRQGLGDALLRHQDRGVEELWVPVVQVMSVYSAVTVVVGE